MRRLYPGARQRPLYGDLPQACEAEQPRRQGLLDDHPDALAFFDHRVHASIAGFGLDATLPSGPRAICVGKDSESTYARVPGSPDGAASTWRSPTRRPASR